MLFPRFNAVTGDSNLTILLFTFSRLRGKKISSIFLLSPFFFSPWFLEEPLFDFALPHATFCKQDEGKYLFKSKRYKKNVVIMDKAFARLTKKGWLSAGRNLLEFSQCFKAFTRKLMQNLHSSNWPHTCKQNKDEWCYLRVTVPSFLRPLSYVTSFCETLVRINVLADLKRKRRSVSRWKVFLG